MSTILRGQFVTVHPNRQKRFTLSTCPAFFVDEICSDILHDWLVSSDAVDVIEFTTVRAFEKGDRTVPDIPEDHECNSEFWLLVPVGSEIPTYVECELEFGSCEYTVGVTADDLCVFDDRIAVRYTCRIV